MSSDDPIESATQGATKAVLDYSFDRLKQLIKRFGDRNIAFIEDPETIGIAKDLRNKGEFVFFKENVEDKELHILFQMGLTLRELEIKGKVLNQLKEKIRDKYGAKGLHIAHFVQNGLFSKYLGNILEKLSRFELKSEIQELFAHIENKVIFIKQKDDIKQKVNEIITKINAHSPETFIISSVGSATKICEVIKTKVIQGISSNYTCELNESKDKVIYFLNRKDNIL